MSDKFTILFYEDGKPIVPSCLKRFLNSFPKRYVEVVTKIIENPIIHENTFLLNAATLLPPFKMTRAGAFKGIKIEDEKPVDPNGILHECWNKIGADLLDIKRKTKNQSRALMELQGEDRHYVINKSYELFKRLCDVNAKSGQISRVGASKVLFSAIPEIALPVDNMQWDKVFRTKDNYEQILSTMIDEIAEWEKQTDENIDKLYLPKSKTLPAVYNIMAMYARPLYENCMPKML
jgi:hypothetical protein